MTQSVRAALEDLALDHLFVVHVGHHRFRIADAVTAIPASEALTEGLTR